MNPDRFTIYLALAMVACGIAAITGPSAALITLFEVVLVVEVVNLVSAPGDMAPRGVDLSSNPQGE